MKRGSTWLGWALAGAMSLSVPVRAEVRVSEFPWRAPIVLPEVSGESNRPVRVALPESVLRRAATDFSDVRIVDSAGEETPLLIAPAAETTRRREYYPLKIVAYRDLPHGAELVLERPEKPSALDGIALETSNRDFRKTILVESSADRRGWKPVERDTLFDFSSKVDLRRNELRLPQVTDRYLRVTLLDWTESSGPSAGGNAGDLRVRYQGLELDLKGGRPAANARPFRIDGVRGWLGENEKRDARIDSTTVETPLVTLDDSRRSVITLDLGNLPVSALTLTLSGSGYYYRQVQVVTRDARTGRMDRSLGNGWIYRLPGMTRAETRVPLWGLPGGDVEVRINNGDNPPLTVANVRMEWVRQDLLFFPQAGRSYQLYFGALDMERPRYDLARVLDGDGIASQPATLGPEEKNPLYRPTLATLSLRSQHLILITVVVMLGAGLGWWAYRLLRQADPASHNENDSKTGGQ